MFGEIQELNNIMNKGYKLTFESYMNSQKNFNSLPAGKPAVQVADQMIFTEDEINKLYEFIVKHCNDCDATADETGYQLKKLMQEKFNLQ